MLHFVNKCSIQSVAQGCDRAYKNLPNATLQEQKKTFGSKLATCSIPCNTLKCIKKILIHQKNKLNEIMWKCLVFGWQMMILRILTKIWDEKKWFRKWFKSLGNFNGFVFCFSHVVRMCIEFCKARHTPMKHITWNMFHKYIACNIFAGQCTLRKLFHAICCNLSFESTKNMTTMSEVTQYFLT